MFCCSFNQFSGYFDDNNDQIDQILYYLISLISIFISCSPNSMPVPCKCMPSSKMHNLVCFFSTHPKYQKNWHSLKKKRKNNYLIYLCATNILLSHWYVCLFGKSIEEKSPNPDTSPVTLQHTSSELTFCISKHSDSSMCIDNLFKKFGKIRLRSTWFKS